MLKKNAVVPISIAVLLVTLLLIMPGVNARPIGTAAVQDTHPPNAMWIEPSTLNLSKVNVGHKFNITAWVNMKDESVCWQINVQFNSTYLKATRAGYTGGTHSQFFTGHNTIPVQPLILNGSVMHGEALLGNDVRAPGNGSLCWVELQVTMKGTGNDKLAINNQDTFVLDWDLNELSLTKYNALIQWSVVVSGTMLYFNISPNPVNSGQNITLKGILVTEFSAPLPGENVQVYARPLTGSWQLLTSVKTNTYGIFTWQATIPQGVTGTFLFAAYYPGSPNYQLTYNFAILTIQ
jgi:hypothetical protein